MLILSKISRKQARLVKVLYVLLILGLIVLLSWLLNVVVTRLGWNALEPYSWIASVIMIVAAPFFAWYSPEKVSPRAIEAKLFASQCRRNFQKYGFDLTRFNELSNRVH